MGDLTFAEQDAGQRSIPIKRQPSFAGHSEIKGPIIYSSNQASVNETFKWKPTDSNILKKIQMLTANLRRHDITKEQFLADVLPALGIEQDGQENLTLYHATPIQTLLKILEDQAIKPSAETGVKTYGFNADDVKARERSGNKSALPSEKVYLGLQHSILAIARSMDAKLTEPGSVYILKVKVNPDNLRPDEDNQVYEDTEWAISLSSGVQTCSNIGTISSFEVVARLPFMLPAKQRQEFMRRDIGTNSPEEKRAIFQEYNSLKDNKYEGEKRALHEKGIKLESIPVIKL